MNRITLLFIIIGYHQFASGQAPSNLHWHFGSTSLGLEFNTTTLDPQVTNNSYTPYTNEGCSVATDRVTGELLFYTDGIKVVDKNHQIMPNGSGLAGNISCFGSGKIFPHPTNCMQYYVFTMDSDFSFNVVGTLRYSIVDMSLAGNGTINDPHGAVTNIINIPINGGFFEALEVVPASNPNHGWIIVALAQADEYLVYSITESGINFVDLVTFSAGLGDTRCIKMNPQGTKGVICSLLENDPTLIFDFNNATGEMTNFSEIPGFPIGNNSGWYGIFDAEWSASGDFLYMSKYRDFSPSGGGTLFQYNLNTPNDPPIELYQISNSATNLGRGLRRGPNNKIYWIYVNPTLNNTQYLGVINSPNISGAGCDFNATGFDFGATIGGTHLFPNFITNPNNAQTSTITEYIDNTCSTDASIHLIQILNSNNIFPLNIDSITCNDATFDFANDSLTFNPASTASSLCSFEIYYNAAGCVLEQVTLQLQFNDQSLSNLNLIAEDSIACGVFDNIIFANSGMAAYMWSNGSQVNSITANETGWYHLTATNAEGCVYQDSVYFELLDFPIESFQFGNFTTCEDVYVLELPVSEYEIIWSDPNVTSPYTFVTDGALTATIAINESCQFSGQVSVEFLDLPSLNTNLPSNLTICEGTNFVLDITANETLVWNQGSTNEDLTINNAGNYTVNSTNACGSTSLQFTVLAEEPISFSLNSDLSFCDRVDTMLYAPNLPNYLWSTGSTDSSIEITEPGIYWLTSENVCGEFTDSVAISVFTHNQTYDYNSWVSCHDGVILIDIPDGVFSSILWNNGSVDLDQTIISNQTLQFQGINACDTLTVQWTLDITNCLNNLFVPNSFSPNGDGINDVWFPVFQNVDIIAIDVYNRWGELIFKGDDQNKYWVGDVRDGEFFAPDGVYTYQITYLKNIIETETLKGHIVLIR